MSKYTILRDVAAAPTHGPLARTMRPRATAEAAVSRPRVETVDLSNREVRDIARDPTVAGMAPVMPTKLIRGEVPAEAAAQNAWGIEAVLAHQSPFTGNGVVASVLDTGIDSSHPAFQGMQLVEQDFSGSGNGDQQGHGTHCAGTIFGRDVNGKRIGIARGVDKALIGKVLDDQGSGDSDMLFRGIQWAQQQGANIISMSLGFDFPGFVDFLHNQQGLPIPAATSIALEGYRSNIRMFDTLMELLRNAAAFGGGGTVVVAASGNESNRNGNPAFEIATSVPAAAEGVLAVGAVANTPNGFKIASFSNTFPQLCAPGVDVLSARAGGGLVSFNGTSMACPHVAGVAALWWEARGSVANNRVAEAVMAELIASARDNVFAPGEDPADFGFGMVTAPL